MSKADQLGSGRFSGGVRSVSARRQAVAAATGVPTEGVAAPTELPVHRISLNPDNPRSTLGDLTDLAGSLGTHGQKQAITVMNRDAYVNANPKQEKDLEPDTTHVVIDGSSRLAAAREAGLATLKVMVSDEQGANSEELLESALVANIHRNALAEMDEARALQRLLTIYGSQTALARRLHRSQGWVSQRLALLGLTPELQTRIGQEPIDLLRAVGNKPAEQQATALETLKAERARKEEARARTAKSKLEQVAPMTGDKDTTSTPYDIEVSDAPIGASTNPGSTQLSDLAGQTVGSPAAPAATEGETSSLPEPRSQSSTGKAVRSSVAPAVQRPEVPFEDPVSLSMLLDVQMPSDDLFFELLHHLSEAALKRDPARLSELARESAEKATAGNI